MGQAYFSRSNFGSIKYFIEIPSWKRKIRATLDDTSKRKVILPAFGEVEKKAAQSVQTGQLLVFGHTHRPFVSPTQNLVNTGSWVNDEETYNTYVELDGKNIRLMRYGQGDITKEMTRIV